jgi:hypothetical protein
MTSFGDNIYSGTTALTSGLSSQSEVVLSRTFNFTGSGTQTFVLPQNVQNLNGACYITQQGSGATSDKITVSAAGQDYITFSSMGSALGVVEVTTVALGSKTIVASAAAVVAATLTTEVTAAITLLSVDTAARYQVQLRFNRLRQLD